MKKFGFATVAATGMVAAALGLAAPALAAPVAETQTVLASASNLPTDVSHHDWVDNIGPHVTVPQVDTSVHQSR